MIDELDIERAPDSSGAYQRVEKGMRPLKRFTVFVRYVYGAPEIGHPDEEWSSIEEIDVNAEDASDAEIVAGQALVNDYEPGGTVVRVEERIGWYM